MQRAKNSKIYIHSGHMRIAVGTPAHNSSVEQLRRKATNFGADMLDTTSSDYQDSRSTSSSSDAYDDDSDDDGSESTPDFVAEQCLFCDAAAADFDQNVIHMASAHSFIVPYQDALLVDLQTLVWYFNLVIYGYHECIKCATRRTSVEAVQQHMLGKGHCRFDISDELADFYDLSQLDKRALAVESKDGEDATFRLTSGRIISQRGSQQQQAPSSRTRQPESSTSTELAVRSDAESQQLTKSERKLAMVERDMAQLSVRDRMALAHLPAHEQRAALVTRRKQIEKVMRAERRGRLAREKRGNKVLQAHFRMDGIGRKNG